jgi:hypothetical protein
MRMLQVPPLAALMVGASVIAACATIASGTTQTITVNSNVDGAAVYLDGEQIGTTPYVGAVPKNKSALRLEAAGYRSENVALSKTLDPLFWGNILIGGTIGSATDFVSGAAYQYAPASYQVEMQRAGQGDADFGRQLVVRKFAMIYIDRIAIDLAAGSGEYLDALVSLMNEDADRTTPDDILAAMRVSRGDPLQFGREIVARL